MLKERYFCVFHNGVNLSNVLMVKACSSPSKYQSRRRPIFVFCDAICKIYTAVVPFTVGNSAIKHNNVLLGAIKLRDHTGYIHVTFTYPFFDVC
jgi:hypothetical protein